ncbi:beta-galactosidase [Planoprotostelium fungivorum]|uniref:Beta-galactosidase n=1 Tax=Planoprotostelium fungivorum TaxID=1890364 RepID=A0A2P6P0R9_9EUKA|nr:beta-galactosidase [Planoprotostelium fungivorum]
MNRWNNPSLPYTTRDKSKRGCRCSCNCLSCFAALGECIFESVVWVTSSKTRSMIAAILCYCLLSTCALFIFGSWENSAVSEELWMRYTPEPLLPISINIEEDLLREDQIRRATLKTWTEISRSNKAKFIDDKNEVDALVKEYQTLKKKNNVTEALLVLDTALIRFPDHPDIIGHKASYCKDIGKYEESMHLYERAEELDPMHPSYANQLAWVYRHLEKGVKSKEMYKKVHYVGQKLNALVAVLDVSWKHNLWEDYYWLAGSVVDESKIYLSKKQRVPMNPYLAIHLPFSMNEIFQISRDSAMSHDPSSIVRTLYYPAMMNYKYPTYDGKRRIRVGYLSPDIRHHAVGIQIRSMFQYHDRDQFEIFVYSATTDPKNHDFIYKTIEPHVEHMIDLPSTQTWESAGQMINDAQVDILIDMGLFTAYSRMDIFAAKPAPIQACWLGLAVTTGAYHYDYIIADKISLPEEMEEYYSEKAVWMPHSYHIFDHKQYYGNPGDRMRPRHDFFQGEIPQNFDGKLPFFYCNFQNNYRFDPIIFYEWLTIIKSTDDSTLILKHHTEDSTEIFKREAEKLGIPRNSRNSLGWPRIMYMRGAGLDHVKHKSVCDLHLDIPKYNGHSTTGDLLWGGVPVLTYPLESMAARAAASFVSASGLPEMVTHSWTEYREKAIYYSTPAGRADIERMRQHLTTNRMTNPLFDTFLFVKHLEESYRMMMDVHHHEKYPRRLEVKNLQSIHARVPSQCLYYKNIRDIVGDKQAAHHPHVFALRTTMRMQLACVLFLSLCLLVSCQQKSFVVVGDQFVKDGNPYTIVSGSFHYFRIHPSLWADRLQKAKDGGLNTIETYVAWNVHEPEEGQYNWEGLGDIEKFLTLCQKIGLLVIFRPTPYICAEWEGGGIPYWLLAKPDVAQRSSDPVFLSTHDRFLDEFIPRVSRFQYNLNGGPIIINQIENEYVYYGTDLGYIRYLKDAFESRGMNKVISIMCGAPSPKMAATSLSDTLRTINAGSDTNVTQLLSDWRSYQKEGPALVTEYYPGWLDHWSQPHQTRSLKDTAAKFAELLQNGISVNFYMYHGGTNFGFYNGANGDSTSDNNYFNLNYQPITTSYDYDAPLSEAGDPTPKYYAYREIIRKYVNNVGEEISTKIYPERTSRNYGSIQMTSSVRLLDPDTLSHLSLYNQPNQTNWPPTFEKNGQDYGFMLYRTRILPHIDDGLIDIQTIALRDRALIWSDGEYIGNISRNDGNNRVQINATLEGPIVDILVENMGRIGFWLGSQYDQKGIIRGVTADGNYVFNWTSWSLPLRDEDVISLNFTSQDVSSPHDHPTFYRAEFNVQGQPQNTYLLLDGWTKGQAWINGFNLGRYWPAVGPQKTLYVPNVVLKRGKNEIILLELHQFTAPVVQLVDEPILNGTIHTRW